MVLAPVGTGVPRKITGPEEWFEELRAVWADPNASVPYKLYRTLTNSVVMLLLFLIIVGIAMLAMRLKRKRSSGAGDATTATPSSTEI
jgi:hypothetical protein